MSIHLAKYLIVIFILSVLAACVQFYLELII